MIKSYNKKKLICGIDEAGRGALAGPVTISAVILPKSYHNEKIKDSKRLSKKKRLELFNDIVNVAIDFSIVNIDVKTIDEINILESTFLGMNQCINELKIIPDIYLIDGNKNSQFSFFPNCSSVCLILLLAATPPATTIFKFFLFLIEFLKSFIAFSVLINMILLTVS